MIVSRFECSTAGRLAQVLARDPGAPYRAHRRRIGHIPFECWAAARGTRLLCHASGAFETGAGAVAWKHLTWDSEFFGFPAARLDVLAVGGGYREAREASTKLIAAAVEDAIKTAGCRHLVARVDSASLSQSHALAEHGFELIDGIQTFALDLIGTRGTPPASSRRATLSDAASIAEIARSSFVYDRFHNDVSIPDEAANRVHEAWARNSVSGEAADAVFVATKNDAVEAFVTVKVDHSAADQLGLKIASIPLVASALEARGQGAARRATEAALAWCEGQNIALVEVGTQISNVPAARLYQSAGFRTTAISLTYRKWID